MSTLIPVKAERVLNTTEQGFNYSDHLAVKATFAGEPSKLQPR